MATDVEIIDVNTEEMLRKAINKALTKLDSLYSDTDLPKILKGDVLQIKLVLRESLE